MKKNESQKNSSTGRMLVALVLVLIGLGTGTYAYLDYSQHKLNELSGAGSPDDKYEVRLVNDFDPAAAKGWKYGANPTISNNVSILASEDSKPAFVRARILEYMDWGTASGVAYTPYRFALDGNGKFYEVSGTENAADALATLQTIAGTKATGSALTENDIFWLKPVESQGVVGDTDNGGWFIKTTGSANANNGILGSAFAYKEYYATNCESGYPEANGSPVGDTNKCSAAAAAGTKEPFIAGSKKLHVDSDNITITDDTATGSDDTPDEASTADQVAIDAGYVPAIYGITPGPAVTTPSFSGSSNEEKSAAFRHYIDINYGRNIIALTDWTSGNYNADLCVPGQGCNTTPETKAKKQVNAWIVDNSSEHKAEGWAYWGSPFDHNSNGGDLAKSRLQESLSLRENMTKDFDYSQYVSMQVATEDEFEGGNAAWNFPDPSFEMAVRGVNVDFGSSTDTGSTLYALRHTGNSVYDNVNGLIEDAERISPNDEGYTAVAAKASFTPSGTSVATPIETTLSIPATDPFATVQQQMAVLGAGEPSIGSYCATGSNGVKLEGGKLIIPSETTRYCYFYLAATPSGDNSFVGAAKNPKMYKKFVVDYPAALQNTTLKALKAVVDGNNVSYVEDGDTAIPFNISDLRANIATNAISGEQSGTNYGTDTTRVQLPNKQFKDSTGVSWRIMNTYEADGHKYLMLTTNFADAFKDTVKNYVGGCRTTGNNSLAPCLAYGSAENTGYTTSNLRTAMTAIKDVLAPELKIRAVGSEGVTQASGVITKQGAVGTNEDDVATNFDNTNGAIHSFNSNTSGWIDFDGGEAGEQTFTLPSTDGSGDKVFAMTFADNGAGGLWSNSTNCTVKPGWKEGNTSYCSNVKIPAAQHVMATASNWDEVSAGYWFRNKVSSNAGSNAWRAYYNGSVAAGDVTNAATFSARPSLWVQID
ncbi:MAG: hypothetical protein LBI63_04285 [Candidatus Ancillula sp.]|nr:hypothetical protein [Candidatus Ancillula sp.]